MKKLINVNDKTYEHFRNVALSYDCFRRGMVFVDSSAHNKALELFSFLFSDVAKREKFSQTFGIDLLADGPLNPNGQDLRVLALEIRSEG